MHVRLGAAVLGSDVIEVGKVDRLVVDPKTGQIVELVAKQGHLLTKDRIITRGMASHVDVDGRVHLSIPAKDIDNLSEFFSVNYTPPNRSGELDWRQAVGTPIGGPRTDITANTTRYTTLPENVVVVRKGMDVQDIEFKKFGELEDVAFGPGEIVTGFTVRSGLLGREHRAFSVDHVAGVGADYVRLNMTSADANRVPQKQ